MKKELYRELTREQIIEYVMFELFNISVVYNGIKYPMYYEELYDIETNELSIIYVCTDLRVYFSDNEKTHTYVKFRKELDK